MNNKILPSIWDFANNGMTVTNVFFSFEQHVSVDLITLGKHMIFSFIYGSNVASVSIRLWSDLMSLSIDCPWLVLTTLI